MIKKVLIVGPINKEGVGGRLEEMKLWANLLSKPEVHVEVFTPNFSGNYFETSPCREAFDLKFSWSPQKGFLRNSLLRLWYSKIFKALRDQFYQSQSWNNYAAKFDSIFLFITDESKERVIFESDLQSQIYLRYTGTVSDFSKIKRDAFVIKYPKMRGYIFHSPSLLQGSKPELPFKFVDQTAILEERLLSLPSTGKAELFGMVGLFMEVKQIEGIIRVFKNFPSLQLLLFGQGELREVYQNLIQELEMENVQIRDFVAPDKIDKVYGQIDVLIINSKHETGPMTGVEAMASSKLILSKPIGAMPTRLSNYPDLLFSTESELEDKLEFLSNMSSDNIEALQKGLREVYIQEYGLEKLKTQLQSLIM